MAWWDCRIAACAFSGSLRGLESVPAKWRYLVPPTSTPQNHVGHNANRWVAFINDQQNTMKSITLDTLKRIVDVNGKLDGWNFSRVRAGRDPVPWDYVDVVRQYMKPS